MHIMKADKAKADAQLAWLESTITSSTADYLIVAGHYPIYSICEHGPTSEMIANVLPLLEKGKVTAYLAGHVSWCLSAHTCAVCIHTRCIDAAQELNGEAPCTFGVSFSRFPLRCAQRIYHIQDHCMEYLNAGTQLDHHGIGSVSKRATRSDCPLPSAGASVWCTGVISLSEIVSGIPTLK